MLNLALKILNSTVTLILDLDG